jgi:uncharacterized phage protein (TIGR01671 family)
MRAIKFRVRDAKGKLIGFNRFHEGRWQCQMTTGGSGEWSNGVLHGAHMEQFIGLQDRNGKDIYEGDVVRQDHPRNPSQNLFTVEWTHGGFYLNNQVNSAAPEKLQDLNLTQNPMEVLGNTAESPELLNDPEAGK